MDTLHNLKENHRNGAGIDYSANMADKPKVDLPYPDLFLQLLIAYQARLNLFTQGNSKTPSAQSFKQIAV